MHEIHDIIILGLDLNLERTIFGCFFLNISNCIPTCLTVHMDIDIVLKSVNVL